MGDALCLRGLAAIPAVRRLIELALDEDLGRGDVTSRVTRRRARDRAVTADMNAREPIVAFGIDIAAAVFALVDPRDRGRGARAGRRARRSRRAAADGARPGAQRARRRAHRAQLRAAAVGRRDAARSATPTRSRGTKARVVDTRKTTPGFRVLEKAAVLAGGCGNHRFDLGSGILIKDNHIAACGSVRAAVEAAKAQRAASAAHRGRGHEPRRARRGARRRRRDRAARQHDAGAGRGRRRARARRAACSSRSRAASRSRRSRDYARAGADLISVGALTHSAPAVDIGLDVRDMTVRALHLQARWLGCHRIELDECGSTNDEAARLARAGRPPRHGRDRRARSAPAAAATAGPGQSPPGSASTCPRCCGRRCRSSTVPPMTLAIGIGVCDAVRAIGAPARAQVAERRARRRPQARRRARRGAEPGQPARGGDRRHRRQPRAASCRRSSPATRDHARRGRRRARSIARRSSRAARARRALDRSLRRDRPAAAIIPAWHERMAHGLAARATIDGAPLTARSPGSTATARCCCATTPAASIACARATSK